jgi:hypothetical protein
MTVVGSKNSSMVKARVPTNSWSGEYWHESTRPLSGLCFRPKNSRHRATNPDTCKLYNLKLLKVIFKLKNQIPILVDKITYSGILANSDNYTNYME